MLINDSTKQLISQIIEDHFYALIVKVLGKESVQKSIFDRLISRGLVSLEQVNNIFEDSYYIGRLRPEPKPPKTTLKELRAKKVKFPISDTERFAIKHVTEEAGNYITKLKDFTKVSVSTIIGDQNIEYRNKVLNETIRPIIKEGIAKRQSISKIVSKMRDSTRDTFRNWQRVAHSEMTNALNLGAHDAIVNKNDGKESKEIFVYKIVKNDDRLCPNCSKFFLNKDGSPKVYRLSELQRNGSNYGRKSADVKPIIGAQHPSCRCSLVEISEGWDFKDGEISYVGVGNEKWRKKL